MWDQRWNLNNGGKSEEPNCRLTQPLYLCSMCGDKTAEDPTGFLRYFVIFNHCLAFIAPVCMLWTLCGRYDALRKRIYSPFLLMATAAIWEGMNESIQLRTYISNGLNLIGYHSLYCQFVFD
mmetsp:Transcript_24169/g.26969  ORF Transcript_24169/g.26969 Transcript_24169/m.26969 type:complete len:122 (-) Transcript_24169:938-1303(-)